MPISRRLLASTLLVAAGLGLGLGGTAEAADNSLKETMKKMQAQVLNGDVKPLGPLFDATKAKAKPEFASWGATSDKGKAAAATGNVDAVKAVCKECHDASRNDYKAKYGSKAP